MNGGQQILALAALTLLSYLILSFGNTSNLFLETGLFNESVISGSALAQSLIEEIQSRAFDENTISQALTSVDNLTLSNSFGPDAGEFSSIDYDDIDDYNGFVLSDTLSRMGNYNAAVDIYYIVEFNPDTRSIERTFSKRIDIKITNPAVNTNITFSSIVSY